MIGGLLSALARHSTFGLALKCLSDQRERHAKLLPFLDFLRLRISNPPVVPPANILTDLRREKRRRHTFLSE